MNRNARPEQTQVIHLRIDKPLIKRIERLAQEDRRTRAYLMRELLVAGLTLRTEPASSR